MRIIPDLPPPLGEKPGGTWFVLTADEREFLDLFRALDALGQRIMLEAMRMFHERAPVERFVAFIATIPELADDAGTVSPHRAFVRHVIETWPVKVNKKDKET